LQRAETLAQVDREGAQIIAELERRSAEQTERENVAAALAVPLIRVTDQVLVAPLVGTVDQKRLYRIRSSLMQGLEDQRARVVLIDLTGVAQIQDEASDLLAQLLSAIELMGCKVLLTGIGRSLAQTLLSQETPLDVETRRDVMSGLARATELMGQTDTLVH
jgi:rsbT co-antagonist protein RsbR